MAHKSPRRAKRTAAQDRKNSARAVANAILRSGGRVSPKQAVRLAKLVGLRGATAKLAAKIYRKKLGTRTRGSR